MEASGLINDGKINLLKLQTGISAWLAGEGKGPFTCFVRRNEGQRSERVRCLNQPAGFNTDGTQCFCQHNAKGVSSNFAQQGSFSPKRATVARKLAGAPPG